MKRRAMLGWLGTSVVAGVVNPLNVLTGGHKSDPVIDYSAFCDDDYHRYDISKPFTLGERIYATDSRIIVTQQSGESGDQQTLRLPPVEDLRWDVFDESGWSNLWTAGRTYEEPDHVECPVCHWDGFILDETPHMNPIECPKCKGAGSISGVVTRHVIDGRKFNGELVSKLRQCGDVEFKLAIANEHTARHMSERDKRIMFFRFGQTGRGMLMPMA